MNVRGLAGRAPRWLWPIVAGVAIAVAALTVVGAETGKDERAEKTDRGSDRCERIVELVGAEDCESLLAALKEGQTLAQIAEANEIAAQTVIDGLVDDAEARITDRVNNGGAEFGRGWHRGWHHKAGSWAKSAWDGGDCQTVVDLVGVADCDALKTALNDGQTLAEIAGENEIEAQTVIDGLVAGPDQKIDAAIEAGKITEEKAEAWRADVLDRVTRFVNEGGGKFGHKCSKAHGNDQDDADSGGVQAP